jgi:hypothetical protein
MHSANLVHRFAVKGRIGDVDPVLKPAHTVCFVGAIRLDGDARDKDCGLGAFGSAAGGKSEDNGGENECFFHVDMG